MDQYDKTEQMWRSLFNCEIQKFLELYNFFISLGYITKKFDRALLESCYGSQKDCEAGQAD